MAVDIIPTSTDGTDLRIGIVVSRFNEYAGRGEFEACMDELRKLGVMDEDVTKVSVPGALEIPFALMKLAQTEEVVLYLTTKNWVKTALIWSNEVKLLSP